MKDFINRNGGKQNASITKSLLKECSLANKRWKEDLRIEKERAEKEEEAKKKEELNKTTRQKESEEKRQLNTDIKTIQNGIKIADELLRAGQKQLDEITRGVKVDKVKLLAANAQISSGYKRKSELELELKHLNTKLQKLK